MATIKSNSVPRVGAPGLLSKYYNMSNSSPRDGFGNLDLQANEHEFHYSRLTSDIRWSDPKVSMNACPGAESLPAFGATTEQLNELRAKFYGRLRYGDVDLGMTAATWRQSSDMIQSRTRKMFKIFTEVGNSRTSFSKRHRGTRHVERRADPATVLANDVLEGQFGWVPLLADVQGLALSAFAHAVPDQFVRATAKHMHQLVDLSRDRTSGHDVFTNGHVKLTYSTQVQISNPNAWILNRLGLINPLVVAWDAVPWSFVVNMFANTNQLISSLTDSVGLTFLGGSLTTTSVATRQVTMFKDYSVKVGFNPYTGMFVFENRRGVQSSTVLCKTRSRVLMGAPPLPKLQLRLPEVNLGLAVIASALVTQKVGGLFPHHFKPVKGFSY